MFYQLRHIKQIAVFETEKLILCVEGVGGVFVSSRGHVTLALENKVFVLVAFLLLE